MKVAADHYLLHASGLRRLPIEITRCDRAVELRKKKILMAVSNRNILDPPDKPSASLHRNVLRLVQCLGVLGATRWRLVRLYWLDVPVLAQDNSGLVAGKGTPGPLPRARCHGSMARSAAAATPCWPQPQEHITFGKETMWRVVTAGFRGRLCRLG